MKILTFDIGGTDIKAGLFKDDILLNTFSFPTFVSGMPKDTNDTVQRVIKEAQKITVANVFARNDNWTPLP